MKNKMVFAGTFALSVAFVSLGSFGSASARSYTNCPAGWTCFNDNNGSFGKVRGNNWYWGNLNGSNWNDRAVRFKNNGNYCRNTLYKDAGYRGAPRVVLRGQSITWKNWRSKGYASSNFWC